MFVSILFVFMQKYNRNYVYHPKTKNLMSKYQSAISKNMIKHQMGNIRFCDFNFTHINMKNSNFDFQLQAYKQFNNHLIWNRENQLFVHLLQKTKILDFTFYSSSSDVFQNQITKKPLFLQKLLSSFWLPSRCISSLLSNNKFYLYSFRIQKQNRHSGWKPCVKSYGFHQKSEILNTKSWHRILR